MFIISIIYYVFQIWDVSDELDFIFEDPDYGGMPDAPCQQADVMLR